MRAVAAIFASLFLFFLAGYTAEEPVSESEPEYYPAAAVVFEIDRESDTVFAEDYNGNVWAFCGAEDWICGDVVSFIMCDMGTPEIYDDEIESVRYVGHGFWER